MPSLYDVAEEFAALEAELTETGGEWTEAIESRFLGLGDLLKEKLDAYAMVIRGQDAYQKSLKDEENALREKRKVSENLVQRLKARLEQYMAERNVREIRGNIWRAVIQANGGLRRLTLLVEPERLPVEVQVIRVEADTVKLRSLADEQTDSRDAEVTLALNGQAVARLEARGQSVRIR